MSEFLRPEQTPERLYLPEEATLEELSEYITLSYWPTIEELCVQKSIQIAELPDTIQETAEAIASRLAEQDYANDEFLFLAQCYHALHMQSTETVNPVIDQLRNDLSSYELFYQRFITTQQNKYRSSVFKMRLTEALLFKTSPLDILTIGKKSLHSPEASKPSVIRTRDRAKQSWVQLRHYNPVTPEYDATYVTDIINTEMGQTKEETKTLSTHGLMHATTSSALDGISRHRALLSRTRLREKGEEPTSGERADMTRRIYADNQFNYGKQYSAVAWFNEFPIQIEFQDSVRQYQESHAPDWGISLGDEVPIDEIKSLYIPSKFIDRAEEWTSRNCPTVKVRSIESVLISEGNFQPR